MNGVVNAVVTLVPDDARARAREADRRLAAGEPVGPLHGLPVACKDTHDTAGIRTTFGSRALADNVPEADELIIERIRGAGAVVFGKTNVPEFAAGSHTFNDVFGVTRNPYDPNRSAGGSSGGAAAALAAGMTSVADGSDMGGSLRNPASFCNVVGLRPSPGRVPSWPTAVPWATMGVQGPMGRTVADTALLLSAIAGPDPRSPIAIDGDPSVFARPLATDLTGMRIAWSPDLGGAVPVDGAVRDALAPQIPVFEQLGATIQEASPDFGGAEEVFRTLRAWQFHRMLGEVVERSPELFKDSLKWNIDVGRALSGPDVSRAEQLHGRLFERVRRFFERYDALLLPTVQVLPFPAEQEFPVEIDGVRQETYLDWMRSVYFVSATGCPALSVPAAFSPEGLPVGLQIVTAHRAELTALDVGHAFEQATRVGDRRPDLVALGLEAPDVSRLPRSPE
ncbi:amidase [Tsukamurella soli]|uniref:Amidase n=1 Tax=Tsukamurella soli TaxID=644556 RepID=A0ABP8JI93_9ACTN